jgi:hypothetical protein
MPIVKVANPASSLMLVNGGNKMRKRKSSTRRRKNPSPAARKRVTIRVNGRRGRRTTTRRRRNPGLTGGFSTVTDAIYAAAGGMATTYVRSLIPFTAGGVVGDAAITAGVGFALGELIARFAGKPNIGKMVTLGGVAAAAGNLLNNYGLTPQALLAPKPQPVVVKKPNGMQDIVLLRPGSYDPYYGTTPRVGLSDIVTRVPQATY